jgi:hypothetical protein
MAKTALKLASVFTRQLGDTGAVLMLGNVDLDTPIEDCKDWIANNGGGEMWMIPDSFFEETVPKLDYIAELTVRLSVCENHAFTADEKHDMAFAVGQVFEFVHDAISLVVECGKLSVEGRAWVQDAVGVCDEI